MPLFARWVLFTMLVFGLAGCANNDAGAVDSGSSAGRGGSSAGSGGRASSGSSGTVADDGGEPAGNEGGAEAGAGGDDAGHEPTLVERPSLRVLSPDAGAVVHTPAQLLTFRIEDAPALAYSVRIGKADAVVTEQALAIGDEIEVPLELLAGVNTVELAVSDARGESDSATWVLVYEPVAALRPSLAIVSPKNGAIVQEAELALSFQVTEAPALGYAIKVGASPDTSVSQAIAVGESVTTSLELVEGSNPIEVAIYDANGEAQRQRLAVVYQRVTAPRVLIDSPLASAFVYGETIAVTGRIVSERPLTAGFRVDAGALSPLVLSAVAEGYAFTFDAALSVGSHQIEVSAKDDRDETGSSSVAVSRNVDTAAPTLDVGFPRNDHGVKTRRVLVRGSVVDNHQVASVTLLKGAQSVPATLDAEGKFSVWLELEPGRNDYELHAKDPSGNEAVSVRSVYFGQRLGAGGAFGGVVKSGEIFTWGRNNLGQTGLDYVSHESRTAYCDRSLTAGGVDVTWCKATTLTNAQAICELGRGAGTPAAAQCKTDVASKRSAICTAAGSSAPTNCATSATANLITACEAAYGAASPTSVACKTGLFCDSAYDDGSAERAACVSRVAGTPNVFPAPATPYSATRVTKFSTVATPAAPAGSEVSFATLGVQFVSLAFNQNAASALDSAGRIWGWGDGAFGVLCLGDSTVDDDANDRQIPHRALDFGEPSSKAIALSRGYNHLLVLRSDGSVWACGQNNVGQLGDGTSGTANYRALPVRVVGLPTNVIQVAASSQSSYALTSDGRVYAWGRNQYGNLGQGNASTSTAAQATPLLVPGLTDVTVLANGRDHVLAARADGSVYAWGLNASNQVGPGDSDVLSPVPVANVTDAVAVYGNGNQGFYEDSQGRLFGWGQNGTTANLGIPESADQPAPSTPVFGLSGVVDVGIGASHGYAMKGDTVFAWGWSFYGSLGGGSSTIQAWGYRTPILVQFLP